MRDLTCVVWALLDCGGSMIYDTTLNITWLADMNYARPSTPSAAEPKATPTG